MNSKQTLRATLIAGLLLSAAGTAWAEGSAPHWTYQGKEGAAQWGEIDPNFKVCGLGKEQSPIDIQATKKSKLSPIGFSYEKSAAEVINNGHTIQVNLASAGAIKLGPDEFKLLQFHFHTPSEEMVKGKHFAMVAHLVHKSADDKLAVVAVLLKEGKENAALKAVLNDMPKQAGEKSALADGIDVAALLPKDKGYYKFVGSLTTPPCSEGVRWQVLKQPVELSKKQIEAFRSLYPMNARPVQPLNGRLVEES